MAYALRTLVSIKKQVFVNFILLVSAIIYAIFIAEILCRVLYVKEPTVEERGGEYDRLLGWRQKPNSSKFNKTEEYSVKASFNSKGIRGPEYSYEKDKDEFRILILGDSFAEGYGVKFHDLFSEVLKSDLNDRLKHAAVKCEVINSGVSGYSTDQELLYFQTEGKKYNPDLTLLMFYSNDIVYNNRSHYEHGYSKPLFELVGKELILKKIPGQKPLETMSKKSVNTKSAYILETIKDWLGRHSRLYNLVSARISVGWKHEVLIWLRSAERPQKQKSQSNSRGEDAGQAAYKDAITESWRITGAIINKLKEETSAINSKLLVFYVPRRVDIYSYDRYAIRKKEAIFTKDWYKRTANVVLGGICKENSIDFIDPTEKFRAEARKLMAKGIELYYLRDHHWNAKGNRLAGLVLSDFIYHNYLNGEN
ncbi:MAG: hypothetical protein A2Z72_02820 [Omnitrophica bacterium RBG_13_46_9]|nr:MAG: hypothetical protein A2Z72_02820 [Omnitrophica bacterium RBG_13_46_9]